MEIYIGWSAATFKLSAFDTSKECFELLASILYPESKVQKSHLNYLTLYAPSSVKFRFTLTWKNYQHINNNLLWKPCKDKSLRTSEKLDLSKLLASKVIILDCARTY